MRLFLVFDPHAPARPQWVAFADDDGDLFVFIANTGRFHRNDALSDDFHFTQELIYQPISLTEAITQIGSGSVGRLDPLTEQTRIAAALADEHSIDASKISAEQRTRER